jgi:hypothetical protein
MRIEIGRTVFTPQGLKIHRYAESLELHDLTNAAKRGKKVRRAHVLVKSGAGGSAQNKGLISELSCLLTNVSYDGALEIVRRHPLIYQMALDEVRGIDVEPAATKIDLVQAPREDGSWLEITSSPYEFRVMSAWIHGRTEKSPGIRHDTNYHSEGKKGAGAFYAWLQKNLSRAQRMTIQEFKDLWRSNGIAYDSH